MLLNSHLKLNYVVTQFWDSGLSALGPEESWTIHGEFFRNVVMTPG